MAEILILSFNLLAPISIVLFAFVNLRHLSFAAPVILTLQVFIASWLAFIVFSDGSLEYSYAGSFITGNIPIRIDYLSAWFILTISFTFLTGAWYGIQYMKQYRDQSGNLALHAIAFILAFTALIDICIVQNAIVFLVAWEIMALSAFVLVIFEHYKKETLRGRY
ncbi:MAG: hypothetical protein U5K79_19340 [Cyclobacteriaceae bacterium]|nr:hypothetical protein [Cyclobacteriaceae bacterium]